MIHRGKFSVPSQSLSTASPLLSNVLGFFCQVGVMCQPGKQLSCFPGQCAAVIKYPGYLLMQQLKQS